MKPLKAFTLIELLVVITIIVVLLALLVPAMDKAIREAEMAVCATNLRTVGSGVAMYAADFKRRYPGRPGIEQASDWEVSAIYLPWDAPEADLRPILRPYMSVAKTLRDPLSEEVDYEASEPSSFITVSYNLWFGFKYVGAGAGASMLKMGDSWSFLSDGKTHRLSVLAADSDLIELDNTTAWSSHPDHTGTMQSVAWQDGSIVDGGSGGTSVTATVGRFGNLNLTTTNWWTAGATYARGPLDKNSAFNDGSVFRQTDVAWDSGDPDSPSYDGRTARVAQFSDTSKESGIGVVWVNAPLR